MAEPPKHIVLLPSPGMGHLIPLIQFANRLLQRHPTTFSITFALPTDSPPSSAQKSALAALPSSITSTILPPVDVSDLPPDAKIETRISVTVARSLPSIRRLFHRLISPEDGNSRVAALVVDLFGTDAFDVAAEFGVPSYIFFPSTAMNLSLFLYLQELDERVPSGEYGELDEPVRIPGCIPIHGRYLLDPVQDRKDDAYRWVLHHCKRYRLADGIVVNSFPELEGGAIKALQEPDPRKPPVYPVGPLVQDASSEVPAGSGWILSWLDEQPLGSVLFASFGSGGTLSYDQIHELALGLEMSDQRFLWVARSPNDQISNATYFTAESPNDPLSFLPKGFLDRTRGRGLVVPSWAPQIHVLAHASTGGFLTHCGWNSTLESVVHGVPLIGWPLYAEQKSNVFILGEDLKVALRPKAGEAGLVGREEIARVVRGLMEGEEGKEIRANIRDLKNAAARVLGQHGSSTKALAEIAGRWTSKHAS